jgi:hypothetical protein
MSPANRKSGTATRVTQQPNLPRPQATKRWEAMLRADGDPPRHPRDSMAKSMPRGNPGWRARPPLFVVRPHPEHANDALLDEYFVD